MAFELPKLPYALDALEPWIDKRTMEIHYGKHHQGYVNKLNAALEGNDTLLNTPVDMILKDLEQIPESIRQKVINVGGGVANHTFFWNGLSKSESQPSAALAAAINRDFGSMDAFKEQFANAAKTVFGSGWAWLVQDQGVLKVVQTSNQDTPLSQGMEPLLTLDVWEHAYYLQFQNRRAEWVDQFFDYINWEIVSERYGA